MGKEAILKVAERVSVVESRRIPQELLALTAVLDGCQDTTRVSSMCREIWRLDLLRVCSRLLRTDFTQVPGMWHTATKLATLISRCLVELQSPETDSTTFRDEFLPSATESLLNLAGNVQQKWSQVPRLEQYAEARSSLREDLAAVSAAVRRLMVRHRAVVRHVLSSPRILQLLITDHAESSQIVLSLLQEASSVGSDAIGMVTDSVLCSLLDELVYKLCTSKDASIGKSSAQIVILLAQADSRVIDLLCSRFRGLGSVLRRWDGKGLNTEQGKLAAFLKAGSAEAAGMQEHNNAAVRIQAYFRGYRTRRRLEKANLAFASFHKQYRERKAKNAQSKSEEQRQGALRQRLLESRRQALRRLSVRQLQCIEILPAGEVDRYLLQQQEAAAARIQACWKGSRERRRLSGRRARARRERAASTLQRAVRRWLRRREERRQRQQLKLLPPLSDEERVKLSEQIEEWRYKHPVDAGSRERQEARHQEAGELLERHLATLVSRRRRETHAEALLARLRLDSQLLLDAPKLSDVTAADIDVYTSRSTPVAMTARQQHADHLSGLHAPWWEKLADADEDDNWLDSESGP
ncbi:PREDICTED: IQ calmodulin-binding motif-containing protein 1-like isoform X2 [Priapulus caudatus]|uniref:IQ calmodulin-binding motif-containing protein 1-like isoform X1 n=1 Tax=Priapulus caudatus TaxID=37621 RepID=A0ABM1E9X9_PRICU|nr:PREDICTED: IQ calmodulin-binding motif-containing protein 1-like isoform X1 [Priapulus caudatus]XP_014669001.1 PREDICTED: IQ calmodulin-binding motif-containing protein 1-like isoform X2 [Priapulus caudatus]